MIPLTARESEVAALLHETNPKIALRLHITPQTVSDHVQAILEKTETSTRTAAALFLRRRQERRDRVHLLLGLLVESIGTVS